MQIHRSFPVLYLSGPRQVGKTTLLKHLADQTGMNYASLDDPELKTMANEEPRLFLDRFKQPLLIDEAQYAPNLFPFIKMNVDNSGKNGLYWLTGSQQFSLMKNVRESLAGRVGIVNLLGFSAAEEFQYDHMPDKPFLPGLPDETPPSQSLDEIFNRIHRGFFPRLTLPDAPPLNIFYGSYLQTYIDRDVRDIYRIARIDDFNRFISLCAARTGQILNISDLARDAGVSVNAANEWLGILETGSQIFLLQPYYQNISKRMIKAPKLYFLDTGFAAYLTKWRTVETLATGASAGAFFETYIVAEIIKGYIHRGLDAPVYYFRDKQKHEIDLIIEHDGGLYPIEIKMTGNADSNHLKNIHYFRERIAKTREGALISLSPLTGKISEFDYSIPAWNIF